MVEPISTKEGMQILEGLLKAARFKHFRDLITSNAIYSMKTPLHLRTLDSVLRPPLRCSAGLFTKLRKAKIEWQVLSSRLKGSVAPIESDTGCGGDGDAIGAPDAQTSSVRQDFKGHVFFRITMKNPAAVESSGQGCPARIET